MVGISTGKSYFHLHFFLVLFAIFNITLAGCNRDTTSELVKQKQGEENAIAKLTQMGAKVIQKNLGPATAWSADLSHMQITNEILNLLAWIKPLGAINLSETSVTDSQIEDLINRKLFVTVAEVDLSHTAVTDQSLERFVKLAFLIDLNLVGTQVTEVGITNFKQQRKADSAIGPFFKEPKVHH